MSTEIAAAISAAGATDAAGAAHAVAHATDRSVYQHVLFEIVKEDFSIIVISKR